MQLLQRDRNVMGILSIIEVAAVARETVVLAS